MGINGFFKTLVASKGEYAGKTILHLGKETKLAALAGKTICFDTSNMIYSAILALQSVTGMTAADGKITSHIKTIMAQVLMFKKYNINQLWIFDSPKGTELKKNELEKRKLRKDAAKTDKAQFRMTSEHVEDIKKLLNLLGITYIIAPDGVEAEQFGAYLTMPKPGVGAMCDYMYSGDADVLIFGGNLLRPMTTKTATGKSKKKEYYAYHIGEVLEATGLNRQELAELAVALGSDFADKCEKIGPKTAIAKVKSHNVILDETQRNARDYFLLDVSTLAPTIFNSKFQQPELIAWLLTLGFSQDRLDKLF
jgi:5'-3' exonuclease